MLTQLWKRKFGNGVIDTDVNEFNQTLAIGDVSGKVFISDYYGNILTEFVDEKPAWGVTHAYLENGSIVLASGHANQKTGTGAVVAYVDDREVLRFHADQPIWDVHIDLKSKLLLATGWGGSLFLFDIDSWQLKDRHETGSPLYGICAYKSDAVLLNVDRTGIALYQPGGSPPDVKWSFKGACYNVSYSPEEDYVVSGTRGPYLTCHGPGNQIRARTDAGEVLAVHASGTIVITGTKIGTLEVRSVCNFKELLYKQNVGESIWNISEDKRSEHLFLAVSDGTVACYHLALHSEKVRAIDSFAQSLDEGGEIDFVKWAASGVPSSILIRHLLHALASETISSEECSRLRSIMMERREQLTESDTFIRAVLDYHTGDFRRAIEGFQAVTLSHPSYSIAALLIAKSLGALGDAFAARQYLLANYSNLETRLQPEASALLADLAQGTGDPGVAMILGRNTQASRANRSTMASNILSLDFIESTALGGSSKKIDTRHEEAIPYSLINYMKYEEPDRAGRAKKTLEHSTVQWCLQDFAYSGGGNPKSLDIGCATCRYPLWFAECGFHAVGYDIDDNAIKICKRVAAGNPNIEIHKRNILELPPEHDEYAVITCMMGTFNHIPKPLQARFVDWIYQSLRVGGVFIASSWNIECPYTSHLYFYNREQREEISANCNTMIEADRLLKESGFIVRHIKALCYLPDDCFESWMGEISDTDVIELDQYLSKRIGTRNAQMFVVMAEKR